MRVSRIIVPFKFLSLVTQLVLTIVIFYSKDENIYTYIGGRNSVSYDDANSSLIAGVVLSVIFCSVEIILLMLGYTLLFNQTNIIQSLFHSLGAVLYAWFILDTWRYDTIWILWGVFCLLPLLIEGFSVVGVFLFFQGALAKSKKRKLIQQ